MNDHTPNAVERAYAGAKRLNAIAPPATLLYVTLWHRECGPEVTAVWVGYPALWCARCHCLAHIDLVAEHVGGNDA